MITRCAVTEEEQKVSDEELCYLATGKVIASSAGSTVSSVL